MNLIEYRRKYCPTSSKAQAKVMYNQYLEVEKISTDMNINYPVMVQQEVMWNYASNPISFGHLECKQQAIDVPCQKGNNPMYVDNDKHIESSKINYLSDRAGSIYYAKAEDLPAQFGFQRSTMPDTTQGLIDAFVTGKFKIKDESKKDTKGYFYRPFENILFIDPTIKEDQAGLDAAKDALKTVYQDTKDMVVIGTPAEGLAAVKTLDAWTPTVGTA